MLMNVVGLGPYQEIYLGTHPRIHMNIQ
jgi:hypothetical protein